MKHLLKKSELNIDYSCMISNTIFQNKYTSLEKEYYKFVILFLQTPDTFYRTLQELKNFRLLPHHEYFSNTFSSRIYHMLPDMYSMTYIKAYQKVK